MASERALPRRRHALAATAGAALLALSLISACAPLPDGHAPMTPAERRRFLLEHLEAQRLREEHFGDGTLGRCETSGGVVRLEGRRTRNASVEGFDTRSCPP
jgi:hypothetical protein